MRRSKATLIYRRTKNLLAVQLLLEHSKLDSTVRYLGIDVDDALEIAEQTEIYKADSAPPCAGWSGLGQFRLLDVEVEWRSGEFRSLFIFAVFKNVRNVANTAHKAFRRHRRQSLQTSRRFTDITNRELEV